MKILLIRPPAKFITGSIKPSISLPTGLLYLAAVLEQEGHTVCIYDAQVNTRYPIVQEPGGTVHMGDSWDTVKAKIAREHPDLVGISCMFSAQLDNALNLAELVKRIDSRITTIIGGSHPTARPKDFFLKTNAIDIVCMGEGELTLREVAEKLNKGLMLVDVPGIAVRVNGEVRINPVRPRISRLDDLPLPAYHLIDLEDYFSLYAKGYTDRPVPAIDGFERSISMITSRGCPYQCIFCSVHLHMGRSWRPHSVGYVQRHIELLSREYGIRHFHFEDDNVSLDSQRFQGILNVLLATKLPITWDTPNGLRVDTLTKDILKLCKDSGCIYLIFGVESGNQFVLDTIVNKHLKLQTVIQVSAWAKEIGVNAMAFYVIGFPGETIEQMRETIDFALGLHVRHGVWPSPFVATPIPGTRLEQECLEKKYIPGPLSSADLARMTQGSAYISTDTFSAADIHSIRKSFIRRNRINIVLYGIRMIMQNPTAAARFFRHVRTFRKIYSLRESVMRTLQLSRWILKNP